MQFRMALDRLWEKPIHWKLLRRTLTDRGYAINDPYIVYKGCRVGKFLINPVDDSVVIYTHSKRKGYCRKYLVRDVEVAMFIIRRSYKNFLYAAERPGVVVREVKVRPRTAPMLQIN